MGHARRTARPMPHAPSLSALQHCGGCRNWQARNGWVFAGLRSRPNFSHHVRQDSGWHRAAVESTPVGFFQHRRVWLAAGVTVIGATADCGCMVVSAPPTAHVLWPGLPVQRIFPTRSWASGCTPPPRPGHRRRQHRPGTPPHQSHRIGNAQAIHQACERW